MTDDDDQIDLIMKRIPRLLGENSEMDSHYEAVALAQTALHATLGAGHPLMLALNAVVQKYDWGKAVGTCKAVVALYAQGGLTNPRLEIARELEESVVDLAEAQVREAEREVDVARRDLRLSVAAFLCGTALEDALRRLCDKNALEYEASTATISKLQAVLYSPSKGSEVISKSENSHVSAWGQIRNNADHGRFSEVRLSDVQGMILGVRDLIGRHLP